MAGNFVAAFLVLLAVAPAFAAEPVPDFTQDVAPILRKYCTGCHNPEDKEGGLSLETYAQVTQGGKHGPAVTAGSPDSSRMVALVNGQAEPQMPPEGMDAPTEADIAILTAWVKAGAKGPAGAEPDRAVLIVPTIKPLVDFDPAITAVAWSPDGQTLAVGRFREVELLGAANGQSVHQWEGLPGKVNSLEFSADGQSLLASSGVPGLYGKATLFNLADRSIRREFQGHRDAIYAAALNPDGKTLATAGYDREIILWDVETGEVTKTLDGHNGAVYDLAFSPDGSLLASASGDETGKVWHVGRGERLDTLSQPEAEQYAVAFRPDGQHVVAAGADNRIRVWRLISRTKPRINPLLHARFAHEGAIVALVFSPDGKRLLTSSEDRVVKLWETDGYTQLHAWEDQSDVAQTVAFSADGQRIAVGRLDGSLEVLTVPQTGTDEKRQQRTAPRLVQATAPMQSHHEAEPNDTPARAQSVALPVTVRGTIDSADAARPQDFDLYRITAKAGEQWVIEVNAARSKSPLDSKVEVLTDTGEPILRVNLQAVRDSYFTFRGKDSDTSDDFRVHNWQEMELNEYLYANGEVVKLWLYPRGPDSGFKVYPGAGKRYTYFDTPALSHALGEPCYIVRPLPPDAEIIPNGLPAFPIYYENDDDGRRKLGADSKLTFTAPADGDYLVRISDVRGFGSPKHTYALTIRPRQPDFRVRLIGENPTVAAGSAKEFRVEAERLDNFDGPIRVDISGLPDGLHVTTPLVIEAGQEIAYGVVYADADAVLPAVAESADGQGFSPEPIRVTATAEVAGQSVVKPVNSLGRLKLAPKPQLLVRLLPADPKAEWDPNRPLELTIEPGQTVMALVRIERNGFQDRVSLGNADAGRNLPHGSFVDNIGLNGLLIVEGANERTFFVTAANWLPESTRTFHVQTGAAGGQASWPAIVHIRRSGK